MPRPTESGDPQSKPEDHHTALHALVRVARSHGVHLSAEQLRRDYAIGRTEAPSSKLVRMAEDNGLVARAATLRWRQLARLGKALPLVLLMSNGQAMVLVGFRDDRDTPVALVADPCATDDGVIAVDEMRLSSVWDGEALFLKRRHALRDDERPFGFLWLAGQVLRERGVFSAAALAGFVLSVFAIAPPMLYMLVVDRVLVHQRLSTLHVLMGGVVFLLVFDTAFGYLRRYLVTVGTAKIDARLSLHIFDRMIGLPIDFFERTSTGSIAYKLGEIWRVRQFLTGQLFGTVLDTMTLFVLIPAMFLLHAPLAFMVLGVALLMCLVVVLYIRPLGRAHARVVKAETRKGSFMIESLHGMRTIKSLALEGRKRAEWDVRVAQAVEANTAFQHLSNQPQTILQPLEKFIYTGSLTLGAYLAVSSGSATYAGSLIAFTMIASRATQPFVKIASLLQQFQEVRGAVAQVASVVNLEPEDDRGTQGVRPAIQGSIAFSEVRFRYPSAQANALDDISFTIPQGSVTGIMGRSGSGKTTVTRLLQGLHRNYEGIIKIDGVDLREIDLNHLRSNIGVVLQDNFLFHGTIRENIMAARQDATLEEVMQAARLAGAEEFIERLPRGYETMLEEGSSNLSGGQRQRIAIARAVLTNPSVLIFDEATSALDPETEAIVNANLLRLAQGRTVIVISHRLASLVNCDQILVLERGKLHDVGRHEDLLANCDVYRHLWTQQNRHLIPGNSHERPVLASSTRG